MSPKRFHLLVRWLLLSASLFLATTGTGVLEQAAQAAALAAGAYYFLPLAAAYRTCHKYIWRTRGTAQQLADGELIWPAKHGSRMPPRSESAAEMLPAAEAEAEVSPAAARGATAETGHAADAAEAEEHRNGSTVPLRPSTSTSTRV